MGIYAIEQQMAKSRRRRDDKESKTATQTKCTWGSGFGDSRIVTRWVDPSRDAHSEHGLQSLALGLDPRLRLHLLDLSGSAGRSRSRSRSALPGSEEQGFLAGDRVSDWIG